MTFDVKADEIFLSLWNRDKQPFAASFQPRRVLRAHDSMAENDVCHNGTRLPLCCRWHNSIM